MVVGCWLVICLLGCVHAADSGYRLDLEPLDGGEPLALEATGTVEELTLLVPPTAIGRSHRLTLSRFSAECEFTFQPQFQPGLPESRSSTRELTPDRPDNPVRLFLPGPPEGADCTGNLFLVRDQVLERRWILKLVSPPQRPATLALNRSSVSRSLTLNWLRGTSSSAGFSVDVRDVGRSKSLENVVVHQGVVDGAAELDLARHFEVRRDDGSSFSAAGNVLVAHADADEWTPISFRLRDLRPGEYKASLIFDAANSRQDAALQTLLATIRVRDHWLWALLVLFAAIGTSYLGTTHLRMRRERIRILQRVGKLRPPWLRNEPATTLLISYVASLRRIQDRAEKWLITGVQAIDSRLAELERILPILAKARRLRAQVSTAGLGPMAENRFRSELNALIRQLGRDGVSPGTEDEVKAEFAKLETWLDKPNAIARFALGVDNTIRAFLADYQHAVLTSMIRLRLPANADDDAVGFVDDLYRRVSAEGPSSPTYESLTERERGFVWLKLLWQRRESREFDELISYRPDREGFEAFIQKADRAAGEWLAATVERLRFVSPNVNPADPPEAYDNVTFEVAPSDPATAQSYFFRHELTFRWNIRQSVASVSLIGRIVRIFRKSSRLGVKIESGANLRPVSNEPRITQFFPAAGIVTAEVRVETSTGQKIGDVRWVADPPHEFVVARSSVFETWRSLRWTEITATLIALVFAVVSGMATFYFGRETFGSIPDYLTLFVWGAAIDQSKNFLQQLQATNQATIP